MKPDTQNECIDEHCKTVVIGKGIYMDGISCPRCDGPVIQKPFKPKQHKASDRALFVRGKICELNKRHCFDLTPEQVDTVLTLGDEYKVKESRI